MSESKYKTIDDYIDTFPPHVQEILQKVRQTIHKAVPDAVETISYHMPTFKLNDDYLAHFAAWNSHVALYGMMIGDAPFADEVKPYLQPKGTIQFQFDQPIPYDLITKIITYQAEQKFGNKY